MNALAKALMPLLITLSIDYVSAQGVVDFRNRPLTGPPLGPDRLVRDAYGQPIVGTNFIAQLLYETAAGSFTIHPDIARFYSSTDFQGWWSGGYRTLTGAGGDGVPVRMQVRAWDAGDGGTTEVPPLTFEQAIADGRQWGLSEIFTYTESHSGVPSPSDYYIKEFHGFELVPEPITWALLGVGVGFLFWRWRRRK